MRFDVSELKTLGECGRKWQLSSRNAFHIRPKGINPNLAFGSLFHECLHALYLGGNPDKVLEQALRELSDPVQQRVMTNIITGYACGPLIEDLEKYQVLDIERRVSIRLPELTVINEETGEIDEDESIEVCGSIDMIVLDKETFEVSGFEHKSAQKFRPEIYITMDEQPRTYFIELQKIVQEMNDRWSANNNGEPGPYKVGAIIMNECKKVQRTFEYERHVCRYSENEINKYKQKLIATGMRIQALKRGEEFPCCNPSYMSCQMCDYANICQMYGYNDLDLDTLKEEFVEEFEVRDCDHLDEKVERKITGAEEE